MVVLGVRVTLLDRDSGRLGGLTRVLVGVGAGRTVVDELTVIGAPRVGDEREVADLQPERAQNGQQPEQRQEELQSSH